MSIRRRDIMARAGGIAAAWLVATAQAASARDALVIGMTLEPPGLDPTLGAASAIAEIVHYNVFETLTRIGPDGRPGPLLALGWELSPDLKTYTFRLRRGVRFHNGEPFNAQAVKFSFERAAAEKSTNKDKRVFANIAFIATPEPDLLVLGLKQIEPDLLFLLGQAPAAIVEPKSAERNNVQPIGTGPYQLGSWLRGASLTLKAFEGYAERGQALPAIRRVTFRFIADPAAQVAALLSGDVDAFPRVAAARSLAQFRDAREAGGAARFQVIVAPSRAKTILAFNHKKKPLDDVRVRRAIAMAIDRKAVIAAAADGFGVPIGSHYVPGAPGYVDLTAVNAYDPARARALLKEAAQQLGFALPLGLSLKLPPAPYARQGGELIAAQLAQIGVQAKLENIEWAQWLSGVYANKAFDMTLIAHVEPFDLGNFAKPGYYWGYESAAFNERYAQLLNTPREADRLKLLGELQRQIANDAVAAYLYQPQWITVAKRGLKGLGTEMPIFVNDIATLRWE
ncbi:ABC transporter substrate-binding protein [Paucibacter sp. APW11]|uniref:ABC transporter substrate-binding protein n=1 Tax=Roseateles aquae TaxID=3077235 RepID=A0ABU3PH81_9BURK|nr:ABC transporter substrate-binding protein [Paucibacter sp. APW11]MDT9001760.1 ABC transporter substrate-binding protein [Paucibacter sp. APW11]